MSVLTGTATVAGPPGVALQEESFRMMWGMSGMMAFMVLGWIVLVAAIVAAAWWFATVVRPARRDGALEILRQRYARGEISREEFERQRRDSAA